ncbi:MAG: hypothetical protein ACTSWJ_02335 [Candidatus Heimdallarchaeaceae archaeon]
MSVINIQRQAANVNVNYKKKGAYYVSGIRLHIDLKAGPTPRHRHKR